MLLRAAAVLVIIDIQDNLAQAMYGRENLFANTIKLIKGFAELDGIKPIAKETFSCWADVHFREQMEALSRRHVVLSGIEGHVCVYQTALDLISNGYNIHLVADAVSSRTKENREIGLTAMKNAGAHLTSTEMVLFELLRTAADPKAKDIFKIVK